MIFAHPNTDRKLELDLTLLSRRRPLINGKSPEKDRKGPSRQILQACKVCTLLTTYVWPAEPKIT